MEDYFNASNRLLSSFALSTYNHRWATVITSRGCPFGCIFCSIHLSMGSQWRGRSAQNVIEEIKLLLNDYRVEHIAFLDDNMSLNKKRMNDICDAIIKDNLKFTWSTPNGLRADTLDGQLLEKMKKSGCTRIAVAPESGSQRVVTDIIGKKLDLREIVRVVKKCKQIKLQVDCFFVMGLPGETKVDIEKTLAFAKRVRSIGATGCNFAIATPFLGTRLHDRFVELGYLREDFDEFTMFRNSSYIGTSEFTSEDLANYKYRASKINNSLLSHTQFITLMLFRDPVRFLRLAKEQIISYFTT